MKLAIRRLTAAICALGWFSLAAVAEEPAAKKPESQPEKYLLRYRFMPGETLRWLVISKNAMRTAVDTKATSTESVSQSVKAWHVTAVASDGNATFEHSIEAADWWQHLQGRDPVRYGSQSGEKAPPEFKAVADTVGKTLSTFTVSARGEIIKRDRKNEKTAPPAEAQFILIPMPAEAVAVGHVWSLPEDVQIMQGALPRRIQAIKKLTLQSVENGIATIQFTSRILTPLDDSRLESQLMPWQFDGVARFDLAAGRLVSQQIDIDRRVVGVSGKTSSVHFVSRFTERLMGPGEKPVFEQPKSRIGPTQPEAKLPK